MSAAALIRSEDLNARDGLHENELPPGGDMQRDGLSHRRRDSREAGLRAARPVAGPGQSNINLCVVPGNNPPAFPVGCVRVCGIRNAKVSGLLVPFGAIRSPFRAEGNLVCTAWENVSRTFNYFF